MTESPARRVKVGVLGCGPIAQAAHFESATKARNAELHAVCDVAEDLATRMGVAHGAARVYTDYQAMLADPEVELVVVATADAFHVPAAKQALAAGKHVLCEKPAGVTVEEVEELAEAVARSRLLLQVGHMKRFDAGIESAKAFIDDEMGAMLALKAWYCDSTHRYAMTDAVQPLIVRSAGARRPPADPKADLGRYYLLAHGSHLVDTARFLAGEIVELDARLVERFGAFCWFVDLRLASGALGHIDLTIPVRMDWHEGFQIYGERGSVVGRTYNPWFFRSSEVDIFREATATTSRVLGADGHFYRRQLEALADSILDGRPLAGATIADGVASIRALVAIRQSAATGQPVRPADASGAV